MPDAPTIDVDPFAGGTRGLAEPSSAHTRLRAAGPIVRAEAPAGGPVWIVTDDALAREVLTDARIVKDPAAAPPGWDPRVARLEPTAAAQPCLTTLDGAAHTGLRRAHTPSFTARRIQDRAADIAATARELLAPLAGQGAVDLVRDFAVRYPTTVVCDLVGVPRSRVDDGVAAYHAMHSPDPATAGAAMGSFLGVAASALAAPGAAAELRDRLPDASDQQLAYHVFALLFAGQLTTAAAIGFLVAQVLGGEQRAEPAEQLVAAVLRAHPPAPFTLWRFTATDVEIGGVPIPARSPVLVAVEGIHHGDGPDLTFGAGRHFCIGAQLATLELTALVDVLRADFPDARLAVPYAELRCVDAAGIEASRVAALPVRLR